MNLSNRIKSVALCLALIMVISQAGSQASNNCVKYDRSEKCIQCADRYYLDASSCKCLEVSVYCKTYDSNTGKCLSCYPGYGSPRNGVCGATPDCSTDLFDINCKCHNDNRVCIKCYAGYRLDEDSFCVEVQDCNTTSHDDHCIKYWYKDSKGKWYQDWFSGCQPICKQCEEGFYLDSDHQCQQLPENCQEVDEKGECIKCEEGYEFDWHYNCVKIVEIPNEDHCMEYWYVNSRGRWYKDWVSGCQKVCGQCDEGYYLDDNFECMELPPNCEEADSDGTCTQCVDGFKLNPINNNCVSVSCTNDDHCIQYSYLSKCGTIFRQWNFGCQRVCTKCADGFYLNSKRQCLTLPVGCSDADQNGTCTSCSNGYVFNSDVQCVPVAQGGIDHCVSYKYVDSKGTWYSKWFSGCKQVCEKCEDNYKLDGNGNCIPVVTVPDPYCVKFNQNGTCDVCAFRTIRDKYGRCKKVSDQCREWDANGLCTACYGGYKLCDGACVIA